MLLGSIIGRDPSGVCTFIWITPTNNWSISGASKIAPHTILGWNGYEISHLSHFTDKQLEGSKQELETIQQKGYRIQFLKTQLENISINCLIIKYLFLIKYKMLNKFYWVQFNKNLKICLNISTAMAIIIGYLVDEEK